MAGRQDTEPTQAATLLHRTQPCSRETPNPLDAATADRNVLQYLWTAAWCFFEEASPDAGPWVRGHAAAVLDGHARQVAAAIRAAITAAGGLSKTRRQAAEEDRPLPRRQSPLPGLPQSPRGRLAHLQRRH